MSKKKTRRHFTPEQKADIVKEHLFDKKAISDLCDQYKIQPSVFYQWQRVAQDNLAVALEVGSRRGKRMSSRERSLEKKVAELEARVAKKDAVIAEISEEYVTLKKSAGNP